MADAVITRAAILALLADNNTKDISPQDHRDAIVSMYGVYGTIYVADGAAPQAGVTTTPEKMTGFAANGVAADAVPDHTDDSITLNTDGIYFVQFECSFSGTVNTAWQFHFRVDGAEQPFGTHRKLSAGGDVGSCSALGLLSLSAAEVITIYVESDQGGGGASFTPVDASIVLVKIA